ncbi:MAG: cyclophilin-like family protein [Pelagibacteraceae bacterium]|jgi:hypothetical protein
MDIEFKTKDISFTCKVKETETGKKILKLLPIKSKISTWGDEIYFDIPKNDIKPENNAKEVFNLGEIAFWNQGSAIAIGFGPTPVSKGSEIRLISKANHWADAINPQDLKKLKGCKDGDDVLVRVLSK